MATLKCLILLSVLVGFSTNSQAQFLFKSWDIDWTTFSPLQPGQPLPKGEYYVIEGEVFVPSLYLREVINVLLARRYQIGFISGGEAWRNVPLLRQFKLNSKFSLADVALLRSREELHKVPGVPETDFLSNRYKKDMETWPVPTANVAHSDDMKFYSYNERQESNLIEVRDTYIWVEDYDEWLKSNPPKNVYNPPNKRSWLLEKTKLVWILGIVISAEEDFRKRGGDFSEHVRRHSRDSAGVSLHRDSQESIKYYQKGMEVIEAYLGQQESFRSLRAELLSRAYSCATAF